MKFEKMKKGAFKKAQKRHQNIQHNRDQIKLLREGKIEQAELFVLDPKAFKKITIISPDNIWDWQNNNYDPSEICKYGTPIVFLYNNGRKSRLRSGLLGEKDGLKCSEQPGGHIKEKDIFGIIVKTEILKLKNEKAK